MMDNDGKADLFRAVKEDKENEVRTLIKNGRAIVNAKDNYGRTPLFYAMTQSQTLIHYLLDSKASMYSIDNCKISILSFFIDKCMVDKNDLSFQLERINILMQRGMNRKKIFETIISIIFSKYFFLLTSRIDFKTINVILKLAKNYVTDEKDVQTVENISKKMRETISDRSSHGTVILEILDLLFGLGADPNIADSDGNTALHYAACLPFYGISEKTTLKLLKKLENLGVMLDAKNKKKETPLLYCLCLARDSLVKMTRQDERHRPNAVKTQVEVWNFLVKRSSVMEEVTTRGESFFRLILDLFQQLFQYPVIIDVLNKEITEKRLFSGLRIAKDVFAFKKNGLSTLHLWASLEPAQDYFETAFLDIVKTIFNCFKKLNVNLKEFLDDKNTSDQTPLHLCRTWTAVQLLLDAGANPNVVDSSGCTPLLVAAKNKTFLQRPEHFYPDVLQEPKDFWKTVLERKLDPWKVNNSGDSILCILLECKAFCLSKHLIDNSFSCQSGVVTDAQLDAICKDRSTGTWKSDYEQIVKKLRGSPLCREKTNKSPVLLCCESILEISRNLPVHRLKKTINWTIVERLLLLYGSDYKDGTGKSGLEKAEQCVPLKDLLSKQAYFDTHLYSKMWKESFSGRYGSILTKVSTFREYKELDQFRYHRKCIAKGSLGCDVFAGLNWKDGMKVAIKRIDKTKQSASAREPKNLAKLQDCTRVIRYYPPFDDGTFLNMIFELMEGNLFEFVKHDIFKGHRTDKNMDELCKQLLEGLHSIHENGIIHCQLIPNNILVKRYPELRLKIAGFSQSCDVGSTSAGTFELDAQSKCWFAPEVLRSEHQHHTKHSDMFSCGLALYFIKSGKHPYQPSKPKDKSQLFEETQENIKNDRINPEWDKLLCPEMIHLLENVLKEIDIKKKNGGRATAIQLLGHPFFWFKTKKWYFLKRISKEIKLKPESAQRFEDCKTTVVKRDKWNAPISCTCFENRNSPDRRCRHNRHYVHDILNQMTSFYDTTKVTELLRFIRNTDQHIEELSTEQADLVRSYIFLDGFPNLVVEVFKAVIDLKWDQTNQEIKYLMTL